ncbi:hypothetical protein ACOMHN_000800 [Nucella lapillus]
MLHFIIQQLDQSGQGPCLVGGYCSDTCGQSPHLASPMSVDTCGWFTSDSKVDAYDLPRDVRSMTGKGLA